MLRFNNRTVQFIHVFVYESYVRIAVALLRQVKHLRQNNGLAMSMSGSPVWTGA